MIVEVRWDETHVEIAIPEPPLIAGMTSDSTLSGYWPLVMLKGNVILKFADADSARCEPLVFPPAILAESCTAEEIGQALQTKLPQCLQQVRAAQNAAYILGH